MKRSATVGSAEQGEILFSMDGVQVFHVSASGEVTTPSYPDTFHLVKFDREKKRNGAQLPPAFIEVGEWTYPLVRGKSPILKAHYGGYMFPDLEGDITGGAVGIIIPDNVTETEIFDSLLAEITTAFKTPEEIVTEHESWSEESAWCPSCPCSPCRVVDLLPPCLCREKSGEPGRPWTVLMVKHLLTVVLPSEILANASKLGQIFNIACCRHQHDNCLLSKDEVLQYLLPG
jgi:hypothetical protein